MHSVRNPANASQRVGSVYLPHSTPGSPKYQQNLVENALTIVLRKGHPTYFITFTCNANWPEIQENLLPGQTSSDRPILVARVFKLKLKQFLKAICKWDGGCEYYFCTVEFQHRGLPHAHIALRVKQPPPFTNNMKHIQVEMPDAGDDSYRKLVAKHLIHGCRRKYADERTGVKEPFACLRHKKKKDVVLRKCRRGYPKPYVDVAYITDTGYPVYARRAPADVDELPAAAGGPAAQTKADIMRDWPGMTFDEICRRVVPHSRELLETFNCHVNVEWAHSVEIIAYLYKYIYKNDSTAWISILQEGDQVQRFMNAQRVSSSEAAWKILRFKINESSHAVEVVHVHNPGDNWLIYEEFEDIEDELTYREHVANIAVSKLERYLNRPRAAVFDDVTLVQYFEQYRICRRGDVPAYAKHKTPCQCWEDDFEPLKRMSVYRVRQAENFVRIPRKSPSQGQVFYVRLLLCNVPVRSWVQLRTDEDGVLHRTFEEAARARDLLNGQDEYEFLFEDYAASAASGIVTPEKLEQLFVICMTQGTFPANSLWTKHKAAMCKNARARCASTGRYSDDILTTMAEGCVLRSIAEHLDAMGKTLSMYDLPEPELAPDAIARYHVEHDRQTYADQASVASQPSRTWLPSGGWSPGTGMTAEQKPIFDRVIAATRAGTGLCQLVDARAGRGKTWLMSLMVAVLRFEGIITLCVASTALAAQNYRGGRTAHSQLCIPAGDNRSKGEPVQCNLQLGSQHASFLRAVTVIVWDEIYNSNRYDIEAVDRMLRELMGNDAPFGGKVMVFGGDKRQIPPVIPDAQPSEITRAVISASPSIAPHLIRTELVHAVRDASDPAYSTFVDSLGDNTAAYVDLPDDRSEITAHYESKLVPVPSAVSGERFITHTTDVDAAIAFAYPDLVRLRDDASEYKNHAIITTTNMEVDKFNQAVVAAMGFCAGDGLLHELLSSDQIADDPNGRTLSSEYLDNLPRAPGVPPHRLQLFVGAMCMLTRNFDPKRGLVNNRKCVIKKIFTGAANSCGRSMHKAVEVALIVEDPDVPGGYCETEETYVIPRILFNFKPPRSTLLHIRRKQFPLALCYAITNNKAQGQTLARVVIDQRNDSFSHGQTYVAFGRARDRSSVHVLVRPERCSEAQALVRNVVYPRLLQ
jgi:hypothetical protein